MQSAAVETLLYLANVKDAALPSLSAQFLRPEKRTQWKRVLGRSDPCLPHIQQVHDIVCSYAQDVLYRVKIGSLPGIENRVTSRVTFKMSFL